MIGFLQDAASHLNLACNRFFYDHPLLLSVKFLCVCVFFIAYLIMFQVWAWNNIISQPSPNT